MGTSKLRHRKPRSCLSRVERTLLVAQSYGHRACHSVSTGGNSVRRYVKALVGLAFLLFATIAIAQTYGQQNNPPSTSTSTSQASTTPATENQKTIEGCLFKEQSDFFLVPESGNPIKLQATAGENLDEHSGHKVKLSGNEIAVSAGAASTSTSGGVAGTPTAGTSNATGQSNPSSTTTGTPTARQKTGTAGTATGTGKDLHKLATKEMTVSNIQHLRPRARSIGILRFQHRAVRHLNIDLGSRPLTRKRSQQHTGCAFNWIISPSLPIFSSRLF
jgi:hypothetical protein